MAKQKRPNSEVVEKAYPDFVPTVAGLSIDELEKRLVGYAKHAEDVEDAKENDKGLEEAKAQVAEFGAPYRDAKKEIRLKSRYIMNLIKEKGGQ